jgi:hypothetical protein
VQDGFTALLAACAAGALEAAQLLLANDKKHNCNSHIDRVRCAALCCT